MRAGPEEGGGIGASVGVCHGPQRPGLLRAVPGRMGESRDARERVSEVTEALKALKPRRSRPAACRVPNSHGLRLRLCSRAVPCWQRRRNVGARRAAAAPRLRWKAKRLPRFI